MNLRRVAAGKDFWIRVAAPADRRDEIDGKWVAFLRREPWLNSKALETTLVSKVRGLVAAGDVRGALIARKALDVGVFFTSADRFEILRTKKRLKLCLGLREEDLYWKADFETDEDWERQRGHLWLLDAITEGYERKEKYLRQGNLSKAARIQAGDIDRIVAKAKKVMYEERRMSRTSMVVKPLFPVPSYEVDPDLIFVLMPFDEGWSDDVYHLVKKVGEGHGFKVSRADDIFEPNIIINDIWRAINRAGLILADITIHNANVFYELGIAHTLGKRVVLLRQEGGEASPFDLAVWRYFEYGLAPLKAEQMQDTLSKILLKHRQLLGENGDGQWP